MDGKGSHGTLAAFGVLSALHFVEQEYTQKGMTGGTFSPDVITAHIARTAKPSPLEAEVIGELVGAVNAILNGLRESDLVLTEDGGRRYRLTDAGRKVVLGKGNAT